MTDYVIHSDFHEWPMAWLHYTIATWSIKSVYHASFCWVRVFLFNFSSFSFMMFWHKPQLICCMPTTHFPRKMLNWCLAKLPMPMNRTKRVWKWYTHKMITSLTSVLFQFYYILSAHAHAARERESLSEIGPLPDMSAQEKKRARVCAKKRWMAIFHLASFYHRRQLNHLASSHAECLNTI